MNKPANTPFAEYREEQVKVNIFDYFVEPSFFDKFCDTKPIIISGARGTGKTTILKALSISEALDTKRYLEKNDYLGVYYRIDLNVTASFGGEGLERDQGRLFSYYFTCKMSYELINQVVRLRNELKIQNEESICQKYGLLFANCTTICKFEDLKELIYKELYNVRYYINNCAYEEYPRIGDYSAIINELPHDLLTGSSLYNKDDKTVFYLIDEFEGLTDWQQRIILSFVKYSDKYHTYKICMRPDGLKTAMTVGGEYIRETDDISTVDLNELILEKRDDYYKYALDVCKKRLRLFNESNSYNFIEQIPFENMLEDYTDEEEFADIFGKHSRDLDNDIRCFMTEAGISDTEVESFFKENYFDFLICRLMYQKNKHRKDFSTIYNSVKNRDSNYNDAVGNYKYALLYYLCLRFSINKDYSGFSTLVNISGGTLRYLLELCNEIFERAVLVDDFDYEKPSTISHKIQTVAVISVSTKRVGQISAVPQIGLNMRTFVISLGEIYRIFHRDDRISKFEPNHFSIKASNTNNDDNIQLFLKECVMRGVLLKKKNNKRKLNYIISSDEYIYQLHPIYTPAFQISWRSKQKTEFDNKEIRTLIGNDTQDINKLIDKYKKMYLSNEDLSNWDYYQMELKFKEDM